MPNTPSCRAEQGLPNLEAGQAIAGEKEATARVRTQATLAGLYSGRIQSALLGAVNVKASKAFLESLKTNDVVARQAASTISPRFESYLREESTTLSEPQAPPEWLQWQGELKSEINGQIFCGF